MASSSLKQLSFVALLIALAAGATLGLTNCGSDDSADPDPTEGGPTDEGPSATDRPTKRVERPEIDTTLRRERATVYFGMKQYDDALDELAPLLTGDDVAARDLVSAAQIALRQGDHDAATARLDQALAIEPDHVGALYSRARMAMLDFELEDAIQRFEKVLELVPDDAASKIGIAMALVQLESQGEDLKRARTLLEEVVDLGLPIGLQWYVTSVYVRWRIALENEESDEIVRLWQSAWDALDGRGYKAASETNMDQGDLAQITPPEPYGTFPTGPPNPIQFGEPRVVAPVPAGTERFWFHDLDGDRTPDLVTRAGGAVVAHLRDRKTGALTSSPIVAEGATGPVRAIDLNQRRGGDTLDLLVTQGKQLVMVEQSDALEGERWAPSPVAIPAMDSEIRDVITVDFDHEGDLDLFVVGDFGARLLSNDGAGAAVDDVGNPVERGTWRDVTEAATLPSTPQTWCLTEDFDADNDVDLICAGPDGVHLMDSQRRGLFTDRGQEAFGGARFPRKPAVADFDGNGRPDLFVPGAQGSLLYLAGYDAFTFDRIEIDANVPEGAEPSAADIDFDGAIDVVWPLADGTAAGVLAVGLDEPQPFVVPKIEGATGPLVVADIDTPDAYADLALELCRVAGEQLIAISPTGELGNAIYLKFIGQKDNRQGVGAVVEVRARDVYRRTYWRGEAETIGIGEQEYVDVIRVTWPNGVVQESLDLEAGVTILLDDPDFGVQPEGLIGSCPFLYTWNGERFEFISDVIGITPLGLPMAPGMLVPPDHDEYVLVRGDQMKVDSNGELVLQFTEELREVTYLDRIRLDVVDHPEGTEVYPNERFTFPPFPEAHTHVAERIAIPKRVTGSDGADWTDELQTIDMRHPAPFDRLAGQYLGLAEPHWLEIEFDPADFEDAQKLRLMATGWFYWSDASVNMAAAGTPDVEFMPPMIQVPGPDGTWVPAGPPIGFPAGKSKTMVIDVTQMISTEDPRMRIGSTLELYWDRIAIATCDDDAELWTKEIEPKSTHLWSRGFSKPIEPERADLPLFFDWNEVDHRPRWNQHPGQYTRYGDVTALLGDVDDRYVIMGSGDALTVRFDASELPELPSGYVRDYLVFMDGWAKDRDPNTHEALEVEPLPFHGMSGYPYRADESFPKTPEHEAWRRDWNTRAAHDWIVPMSPKAEARWLQLERKAAAPSLGR